MRRILTAAGPLIAVVAYLALAGHALAATTDPACDPWDNRFEVHGFDVDTGSDFAFVASAVETELNACGSRLVDGSASQGVETLFDRFDVVLPPGVEVNDAETLPLGLHVGQANLNVLTLLDAGPWGIWAFLYEDEEMWVWVHDPADCESENESTAGGPRPGAIVVCYLGRTTDGLGHAYIWVTRAHDGRLTLTIGPFRSDVAAYEHVGITTVDELSLCLNGGGYLGPPCGSSDQPWVQKNGAPSPEGCQSGNGMYSVTATNKAGETTAATNSCVRWRIGVRPAPAPPGSTSKLTFDPPAVHYRGPDPG